MNKEGREYFVERFHGRNLGYLTKLLPNGRDSPCGNLGYLAELSVVWEKLSKVHQRRS